MIASKPRRALRGRATEREKVGGRAERISHREKLMGEWLSTYFQKKKRGRRSGGRERAPGMEEKIVRT